MSVIDDIAREPTSGTTAWKSLTKGRIALARKPRAARREMADA